MSDVTITTHYYVWGTGHRHDSHAIIQSPYEARHVIKRACPSRFRRWLPGQGWEVDGNFITRVEHALKDEGYGVRYREYCISDHYYGFCDPWTQLGRPPRNRTGTFT